MATATERAKSKAVRLHLYDLNQVSRFLHAVAYSVAAANNVRIVHQSFLSGGDLVETGDQHRIRIEADRLASSLMHRFSALCKGGSPSVVDAFLQQGKRTYISSRQSIDAVFAQARRSNQALQTRLGIAADVTHIVHGAANATFGVLSFFVTGGAGVGVAQALNIADDMISKPVIGVVGHEIRDEAIKHTAETYSKRASNTLANIVTRNWKYQGALRNAQTRLVTQTGVAAGAHTLHIFFAVQGIRENLEEIGNAAERLAASHPAAPVQVARVPDLQIPLPK
jgi:hypothetical protein